MKKEQFLETIGEFRAARNDIYAYYVTYKDTDNITSQKWGKINELEGVLSEIETVPACIVGELPIERLIVYADEQCLAFTMNPKWDCVNEESEDSHFTVIVPYIGKDGWFGEIVRKEYGTND
jgi:hypothetical protein